MDNSFAFWQGLEDGAWVETLRSRLAQLSSEERGASIAYLFSPLDWRVALRASRGPLARVPFLVKDLFDIQGQETYASSRFLGALRGKAKTTATFVERLQSLGAVLVGKTHLHEFAYGLSGENPHYGNCPHPFLENRLTGGSSSGSAFAVGRGIVPLSVGTDTGGSIRVPASYCHLYGFRGVPGLWTEGCFPLAERFDAVGCFTTNDTDLKDLLQALSLPDWSDDKKPLLLLPPDFPLAEDFRSTLPDCTYQEEQSRDFFQPSSDRVKAFTILQSRQAYLNHKRWLEKYRSEYDPAVYKRIAAGRDWSEADIQWAESIQEATQKTVSDFLSEYSSLLLPGAPSGSPLPEDSSEALRKEILALTVPASLAGLPVVSLPHLEEPYPVGVQKIFSRAGLPNG